MHRCYPECRPGAHVSKSMEEVYRSEAQRLKSSRPDPSKFDIKDVLEYGTYKVLLVHYSGCTTFDGMKCLVATCSMVDLVKAKNLDPHFDKTKPINNIEIIARFPPTETGINHAKTFASLLQQKKIT